MNFFFLILPQTELTAFSVHLCALCDEQISSKRRTEKKRIHVVQDGYTSLTSVQINNFIYSNGIYQPFRIIIAGCAASRT